MFIQSGSAQLFSVSFGSPAALSIVGLGGWIGNWELWLEPFSILSARYHCIAFDHRGSGITQAPLDSITFQALVDDVFVVLEAYGIERCLLAAESFGTAVALAAALQQPARFFALALVDGAYSSPPLQEGDAFLASLQRDYPAALERFVQVCTPESGSEPVRRWGRQILKRADPEAAIALYRLSRGVDLRPDLGRLTLPTLIIHGDRDALVPLEAARYLVQALPDARLVVLEGAGHVPTLTRPQEVAGSLLDFLSEVS